MTVLKLDGVGAFYGMSPVLREIEMQIRAGEAIALLGRNGAGKTTLLRTIAGLHEIKGGSLSFNGENLTRLPAHERARRGISLVPQGRGIFPLLTVEENLRLGESALTGRIANGNGKAKGIGIDYVMEMFPVLARYRARHGGVLSGGEQQQLAIARALITQPSLLLLDEPTEGIQPSIVREIETAINHIRRELGIAVILVEQYLQFAWSIADRYYVMQRGKLVRQGSTGEESPDAVAHLLSV
jgi:urea transport system ATP-binding protein